MPAAAKKKEHVQVALRMPTDLTKRVDAIASKISMEGVSVNRSDAIRMALYRGVDMLEEELKKGKK